MPTLPPSQTTPPIDPLLVRLAEPISRYLESERLQRRLLGDCSYSPSDYQLDHWSAWEAGGCYTLAAALRPLLAPAGLLAGVYVTTDPSDDLMPAIGEVPEEPATNLCGLHHLPPVFRGHVAVVELAAPVAAFAWPRRPRTVVTVAAAEPARSCATATTPRSRASAAIRAPFRYT